MCTKRAILMRSRVYRQGALTYRRSQQNGRTNWDGDRACQLPLSPVLNLKPNNRRLRLDARALPAKWDARSVAGRRERNALNFSPSDKSLSNSHVLLFIRWPQRLRWSCACTNSPRHLRGFPFSLAASGTMARTYPQTLRPRMKEKKRLGKKEKTVLYV